MSDKPEPKKDVSGKDKLKDQADESAGTISGKQVTKDNIDKKDLPRGSEPETRASSQNRR